MVIGLHEAHQVVPVAEAPVAVVAAEDLAFGKFPAAQAPAAMKDLHLGRH